MPDNGCCESREWFSIEDYIMYDFKFGSQTHVEKTDGKLNLY